MKEWWAQAVFHPDFRRRPEQLDHLSLRVVRVKFEVWWRLERGGTARIMQCLNKATGRNQSQWKRQIMRAPTTSNHVGERLLKHFEIHMSTQFVLDLDHGVTRFNICSVTFETCFALILSANLLFWYEIVYNCHFMYVTII